MQRPRSRTPTHNTLTHELAPPRDKIAHFRARAHFQVREWQPLTGDVEVVVGAGTYTLNSTWLFGAVCAKPRNAFPCICSLHLNRSASQRQVRPTFPTVFR